MQGSVTRQGWHMGILAQGPHQRAVLPVTWARNPVQKREEKLYRRADNGITEIKTKSK